METGIPGKTVLIVDDEPAIRELERRILEGAGFQVFEAEDGDVAIEFLKNNTPLTLVVADVDMPNLPGDQLAKQLQTLRPGLKVLFVTGHVKKLFQEAPLLEDNRAFLAKPFTSAGLTEAVSQLVKNSIKWLD
jgi:two-component system cell cycle sensor histidine kinase/response regulator CckA